MTVADLKRLPNFTDKFPSVVNGGLLEISPGHFKAFADADKLSTAGLRANSGKNAPETTVHAVVFEVGPRGANPTTFSLGVAAKVAPTIVADGGEHVRLDCCFVGLVSTETHPFFLSRVASLLRTSAIRWRMSALRAFVPTASAR